MSRNRGSAYQGLLITIGMKGTARRVAIANICFNVIGVLLILPFVRPFAAAMDDLSNDPGITVAWAQFLFPLPRRFRRASLLLFTLNLKSTPRPGPSE